MAVEDVRMGKAKRAFKDSQVSGLGNRVKCGIFPNTGHMRQKQGCEVGLMSYNSGDRPGPKTEICGCQLWKLWVRWPGGGGLWKEEA